MYGDGARFFPCLIHCRQRPSESELVLDFAEPKGVVHGHSVQKIKDKFCELGLVHIFCRSDLLYVHDRIDPPMHKK